MVYSQQHNYSTGVGGLPISVGRFPFSAQFRQRGLYIGQKSFSVGPKTIQPLGYSPYRHVCLPRKFSIKKISSAGILIGRPGGGLPSMSFGNNTRLLCQSPLVSHRTMVATFKTKSSGEMPHHSALVGFHQLVAPSSEAARSSLPHHPSFALQRSIKELPRTVHAYAKVAPDLHSAFRFLLEERGVPNHPHYDTPPKKFERYCSAWKLLFGLLKSQNINPLKASKNQVASAIATLFEYSVAQSRNAYAALTCLPGFSDIRFHPLLQHCNKAWSQSEAKYAYFWDPSNVLHKLKDTPLDWTSIPQVRTRLLLIFRFFQLARSIDLARLYRCFSKVDGKTFILWQRKGWQRPRWEDLVRLKSCPAMCPDALLKAYVHLTASHSPPGHPVFVAFCLLFALCQAIL